jgi:hypothetical protein
MNQIGRTILAIWVTIQVTSASALSQEVGGAYRQENEWNGNFDRCALVGLGDLNGDGHGDFAIGAPRGAGNGSFGMVTIRSGFDGSLLNQWVSGFTYDYFGAAIACAGDVNADGVNDLIVGASGSQSKSAFVYSGSDFSLLHHIHEQPGDIFFGEAVGAAGDVNQDGFDDFIVGAPGSTYWSSTFVGAVYVFSGVDGSLLRSYSGPHARSRFGCSVAAMQDLNGDGYPEMVIGADHMEIAGMQNAGAASLHSGKDGALIEQWHGPNQEYFFATEVGDAGDMNGDGVHDIVIGSPEANPRNSISSGSVSVFSGSDGTLLHQWDGQRMKERLGYSVAGLGDINQDGFDDLGIGLPDSGWIYDRNSHVRIYSGGNGALLQQITRGLNKHSFGASIAGIGDSNGDGWGDIVIAGSGPKGKSWFGKGAVYLFRFSSLLTANHLTISASAGGVLNLDLHFPDDAGLYSYKVLISTGLGPTHLGVWVPLTFDSLFLQSFTRNYPVHQYSGMHGTLSFLGNATASMTFPAGMPSSLIGNTYYLAAVANPDQQMAEFCSRAAALTITP